MTPCRMLTNAKVENIMRGGTDRYPLATDRKQKGVNETVTPCRGVEPVYPLGC